MIIKTIAILLFISVENQKSIIHAINNFGIIQGIMLESTFFRKVLLTMFCPESLILSILLNVKTTTWGWVERLSVSRKGLIMPS